MTLTPERIEQLLRYEWWLNHGHDISSLYGDDGEMQCGRCFTDFKRMSIDELERAVLATRAERARQRVEKVVNGPGCEEHAGAPSEICPKCWKAIES